MQIGPYDVIRELGRGGMGVVYLARDAALDREFAVKVLTPGQTSAVAAARFEREARAAAALAGTPGIVSVHRVGSDNGTPWLAMDYIAGRALDDVALDDSPPAAEIANLGARLARALAAAHATGITHRDVKPANVLLDASGAPWLTDFGLATARQLDAETTRLTKSGEIVGTPAYMAPEQVRGEPADHRADIYALGATLYDLVSGAPPFTGESTFALLRAVLDHPAPPLRQLLPGIAADLDTIVMRCLEKEPGDRYQTAAALADDLERFTRGEAVSAAAPSAHKRAARWAGRRRGAVAATGVVVVMGGGLALLAWQLGRTSGDQTEQAAAETARTTALGVVTQISQAFAELMRDSGDAMHTLSAASVGQTSSVAQVEAAHRQCLAVAATTGERYQAARGPGSWTTLANYYLALRTGRGSDADDAFDELEAAAEASPLDPFPAVLFAKVSCGHYMSTRLEGVIRLDHGTVNFDFVTEAPAARAFRNRAEQWLSRHRTGAVWPTLPDHAELEAFGRALSSMREKDYRSASADLDAVCGHPLLRHEATGLAGLARLHTGDAANAQPYFARLIRDRVRPGYLAMAQLQGKVAVQSAGQDGAGMAPALDTLEVALQLWPRSTPVVHLQATLHIALAAILPVQDPRKQEALEVAHRTLRTLILNHPQRDRYHRQLFEVQRRRLNLVPPGTPRTEWGGLADEAFELAATIRALPGCEPFAEFATAGLHLTLARLEPGTDHLSPARKAAAAAVALTRSPGTRYFCMLLAIDIELLAGERLQEAGEDPSPALDRAEAYTVQSAGNPRLGYLIAMNSARLLLQRARWRRSSRQPAAELYQRALDLLATIPAEVTRSDGHLLTAGEARAGLALELDPASPERPARFAEARLALDRAIAASPRHAYSRYARARVLLNLGFAAEAAGQPGGELYRTAVADLELMLDRLPRHGQGWQLLGTVQWALSESLPRAEQRAHVEPAARAFERAAELQPTDTAARRFAAAMRMKLGDPQGAVRHLEAALRLAPQDSRVLRDLKKARAAAARDR